MRLSRRTLLRAAAAMAATSLAGCATGGGDPLAGRSTAVPEEPVSIGWMAQRLADNEGRDLRRTLAEAFQRRYPTITVHLTEVPPTTDVRRTTLTTQIASGSPQPDVYLGDCVWPAQFAHNSLAAPLGAVAEHRRFWDGFPEPVAEAVRYGRQAWAYPLYVDYAFLYYRADLLDKHGLAVPRTWEELVRTALRLKEAGDVRYGFVWQAASSEALTCNVNELLADAGGALMDAEARRVLVRSDAARHTLEFMAGLVADGVSPAAVGTFAEEQAMTAFSSGQAAFLRNWSYAWGAANAERSAVRGKVGATLRPAFDGVGRRGLATMGGWHNFVNPHTEQLGAALAFARWMAEEEAQTLMATTSPYTPALSSVLSAPAVVGQDNPTFRLASEAELVLRPTRSPYYPQISKAVYTNVNPIVVAGGGDVGGAVDAMADEMTQARDGAAL
ncbi:extracellular solute-binding protein [Marinitenerispora sediminis]|uniref:ABC transporter substrate-binding protein n=1 Tax=Marinitenerispora sediminis TaxID=1931232 RepID=A0A368TAN5_9ACTN|nr:extracellular solute-binding protein [Marinitenerispora sediminis]RCV51161.1 ABC transporter substrate-binding protein [Marinitenerispora sediminis]RCV57066.1 ABC transporter substrate-binding protein [Marinitenerispora sediminis]RCV59955.1 ABC transporter substrate-binding protein [Marinitenerispora sediminis]